MEETAPLPTCPECRAGKHDNCDGDGGWDDDTDQPLRCRCWTDGHPAD